MHAMAHQAANLIHKRVAVDNDVDYAIDGVFECFILLSDFGNYDMFGCVMMSLDVTDLPVAVMLAPLTISNTCSGLIPQYASYYNAVKYELEKRNTPDIEALLQGLAP